MEKNKIIAGFIRDVIREYIDKYWVEKFTIKPLCILGAEVTQAIQYFRSDQHLTDPADRGADNSLRLVAYKPAWIRVYVRGSPDPVEAVGGTVVLERQVLRKVWDNVMTLTAERPGSITAEVSPIYSNERMDIGSTLNFIIPGDEMWGNLRLTIEVHSNSISDTKRVEVDARLKQTMKNSWDHGGVQWTGFFWHNRYNPACTCAC